MGFAFRKGSQIVSRLYTVLFFAFTGCQSDISEIIVREEFGVAYISSLLAERKENSLICPAEQHVCSFRPEVWCLELTLSDSFPDR
jgi:hypothetical protein